ncbi:MAG: tyrosine-protein phosphatase [Anaerolineae bacterium]
MSTIVPFEANSRHIPLDGCYNLRDIGGYPTRDGKMTRWRTVYRSDSLHRLTADSQNTLLSDGLKTIIDLRFPEEVQHDPNVFAASTALRYHHIPLILRDPVQPNGDGRRHDVPPSLYAIYLSIIESYQSQVRAVLTTLSESSFPVLIHCTAGKDRTGVIIALLLGLAGVEPETIVEDYALTSTYLTPLVESLKQRSVELGIDPEVYAKMLETPPQAMHDTLIHIASAYGGVEAYLHAIGLTDQQLKTLRDRLVE